MENRDLYKYNNFIIDFLEPLVRATESPEHSSAFLMRLGYEAPSDVTAFNELSLLIKDVFGGIAVIDELVDADSNDNTKKAQALIELLIKSGSAVKHLNSFSTKIQANYSGSAFLTLTDIVSALPRKITDLLFINYIEKHLTTLHSLLLFTGIIEEEYIDEVPPYIPEHKSQKIHWDKIPQLLTNPIQAVKDTFKDGDTIKFNKLIFLLEQIGISSGVFAEVNVPDLEKLEAFNPGILSNPSFQDIRYLRFPLLSDPFADLAIELYPLVNPANEKYEGIGAGIILGSEVEIPLGDQYLLKLDLSASLADSLGVKINKDGISFNSNIFTDSEAIATASQIKFKAIFQSLDSALASKFLEVSLPGGSKIEIGSGSFTFGVEKKGAEANFYIEADLKDGLVQISLGEADSFIGSFLSGNDISSNFNLGVGFSSKGGLYFKGGSLEISLPAHIQIGPVELLSIALGLKMQDQNFAAAISTSFIAQLGPLSVSVENIGIQSNINIKPERNGNFGPFDVGFGFKPPNGLGLSINAGAVTGGGYLFFDFEKEEYAGALELSIAGFIAAKAIGLITTKMPDGSKGFSMLIIITAEFNPPFQLGYGFTLNGVGGLLGLNRTVLLDPLRDGVRTGSVNSIMFPQNVIANAPRIISDLKTIFPPYEGKFLIGPMAKIGWGTPTLISLSLGLIIEIPGNIAILGVLKIALPEERIPLVQIQVAFVGTVDFNKKMLSFDASLYESFILTMTLEGDMAVRLKWGENPDFILSVGGFHPSYTPPPLALPTLRRLAINILNTSIAKIRVECYQAITSNTVQFGAKAEIFFDLRACSIKGHVGFDALFQFSPFYFIIQLSASFTLKAIGIDVMSVRVKMSLEGPTPWRAKGTGRVSLLFFDISANFDKTWGESKNTSLPDIAILPGFIEELTKKEQWSTILSSDKNLLVSLRKFKETAEPPLVLHPAGSLVIQQKLLPLAVKIEKIGNQKTSDIQKVLISGASSAGVPLHIDNVNESFARAQYQNLSDADKLSKPSFEKMPGGVEVSMGTGSIKNGKLVRKKVEYEVTIVDKESQFVMLFTEIEIFFSTFLKGNSTSKSPLSKNRSGKLKPFSEKLKVKEEGYTVAFQSNNKAFNSTASFASEMLAHTYMQETISKNPALKKEIHIVPNYELQES